FMDSVGLGVLVTVARGLETHGRLVLENPQHVVARAIELAGLLEVDNILLSVVEAPPVMLEEPPPPSTLSGGPVP
ncbi:MAG TPA: STAS domain-containing protein, partial [Actinomycetota bacterium]